MTNRLAGHALVEALIAQGVDTAFGVPGESYLAVLDGLHEHRDRIRFVACRHEGGASFMAEAQGKLTGRPGVCFVTRGPGATNAAIGVHTAFQDSTPMVVFVGQVASDQRDREAFQELDYRQMFGPGTLGLAKWAAEVPHADRLPEYVSRAFHTALQGRPGPVVLALPEDLLSARTAAPVLPRVEPALAWPARSWAARSSCNCATIRDSPAWPTMPRRRSSRRIADSRSSSVWVSEVTHPSPSHSAPPPCASIALPKGNVLPISRSTSLPLPPA